MRYTMLFIGHFDGENTSVEFFSRELASRFESHGINVIRQNYTETALPRTDVIFFHTFNESPAVRSWYARQNEYRLTVAFMENPMPFGLYNFYYNQQPSTSDFDYLIPPPVIQRLYNVVPKRPGSILLDHDVEWLHWTGHRSMDWNAQIWDALHGCGSDFPDIYQLARGEAAGRPDFVKVIPVSRMEDYLKATEEFETFVSTHMGSFNHTAVDMAIRGTRVLVPKTISGSFVPQPLVDRFQMQQCNTIDELMQTMKQPPATVGESQVCKTIDLDDVVTKICKYLPGFQE